MRIVKYSYSYDCCGRTDRTYFVAVCYHNDTIAFFRYMDRRRSRTVNVLKKSSVIKVFAEVYDTKAVEFIKKNWNRLFEGTIKSKIQTKVIQVKKRKNCVENLKRRIAKLTALKAKTTAKEKHSTTYTR